MNVKNRHCAFHGEQAWSLLGHDLFYHFSVNCRCLENGVCLKITVVIFSLYLLVVGSDHWLMDSEGRDLLY